LHRTRIKQKLLGERRFARVGVRNNGECASARSLKQHISICIHCGAVYLGKGSVFGSKPKVSK
jgi:hypothetical protein